MYIQIKSTTILSELKHSFTNNITHWYINLLSLKPYTITRYFLSFLILFVFLPQAIHAQEYKITGTVRDLITENGIDSARVELLREDSSLVAVRKYPLRKRKVQTMCASYTKWQKTVRPLPSMHPHPLATL